jgi:hypothetical protein
MKKLIIMIALFSASNVFADNNLQIKKTIPGVDAFQNIKSANLTEAEMDTAGAGVITITRTKSDGTKTITTIAWGKDAR